MKDELIIFSTAKLAKEKGFNITTRDGFLLKTQALIEGMGCNNKVDGDSAFISAPTQSLLQRWLREVHKYHIQIEYDFTNNNYAYHGFDYVTVILPMDYLAEREIGGNFIYDTYEEALELGLQEALKLINVKK